MQHLAALRVQVRAAWPGGGQGKGATDDVLLGGQRASARPGATVGHGDAAGSRGGGHGRVSGGQTGSVAAGRSPGRVRHFRLINHRYTRRQRSTVCK